MSELMASHGSKISPLKKGAVVSGIVKKLTPQEILLDIGGKGDALVLEFDRKNLENLLNLLKIGDKVSASVLSSESEEGFPVVSLRRTLEELLYSRLESKVNSNSAFNVRVVESTRGGYFTETDEGIHAFLPNSQVLSEGNIIGKTLEVKAIEFDKSNKRVILSEKSKIYLIDPRKMSTYVKAGNIIDVVINQVSSHGIYVNFQPETDVRIEGFIHISEVSYQHIDDLKSMFKKGETLKAQVIDIDTENRRVNLSLKKFEKDKFEGIKSKYIIDQQIQGKVLDVKTRGITVEIEPGINGLIQSAKIPSEANYKAGDLLNTQIIGYDDKNRNILLTPVMKTKFVGYR